MLSGRRNEGIAAEVDYFVSYGEALGGKSRSTHLGDTTMIWYTVSCADGSEYEAEEVIGMIMRGPTHRIGVGW